MRDNSYGRRQLQGRVLLHSTPTLTSASHSQRFSALPRQLSHQRESHRREPPCNNESCLSTTGACHDAAKEPSRGGLGILFPIWTPTSKTGRGQGATSKGGKIHFKQRRQAMKKRGLTSKGGEGTVGRDEWNRWNDTMSMNRGANDDYNLAPAIATQRGGDQCNEGHSKQQAHAQWLARV